MGKRAKMLALSNPVEGKEEEFDAWYDATHINEIGRLAGFGAVKRYKIDEQLRLPARESGFASITIYDFADRDMALAQMAIAAPKMTRSDSIDLSRTLSCLMEEIFVYKR